MDIGGLFSLSGSAALVTGASSGIGRHMAHTFGAAGAKVVLAARRRALLTQAVDELRHTGIDAHAVELDVTDPDSIRRCWSEAEVAAGQPIDVLFNNAGVLYMERFVDQSVNEIDRVLDTNLRGAMLVAQQAARSMAEHRRGSIINVASTSGLRAAGHLASYAASKAAILHLTGIMALELASRNVRVNALCPGNMVTDMAHTFEAKGFEESLLKRIPMRRFGEVAELDGAALLLASPAGRYMTGATLTVDGGQVLSWM